MAELRRRLFWCRSRWCAGEAATCNSSTCSGGVDGGSEASEDGIGDRDAVQGDPAFAVRLDARRVELVDADEVVESSASSTTFQV